jgi:hypothetical protein
MNERMINGLRDLSKPTDLMPIEKVCPECGGMGDKVDRDLQDNDQCFVKCPKCKGKKVIQLYYTPADYERIMGKPFPDDAYVWYIYWFKTYPESKRETRVTCRLLKHVEILKENLNGSNYSYELECVIVQTAQPAPDADYRPIE